MPMKQRTGERKSAIKNSIGRVILVALLILLQIACFMFFVLNVGEKYPAVSILMRSVAVLTVLGINSRDNNSRVKLVWVIIILTAPVVGLILFFIAKYNPYLSGMKNRLRKIDKDIFKEIKDTATANPSVPENQNFASVSGYLKGNGFPVFSGDDVRYFNCAADCFKAQLEDINNARSTIYLEYHAIENSESFAPLHAVLKRKAAEGVDCRILYDDIGSFVFVDYDFMRQLNSEGIKCNVFNRAMPVLSIFMNNRDHRKLTVIDGHIGYTGGFNIADEYFNITSPYGYWKDSGIRVEGPAVDIMSAMFAEMWNFSDMRDRKHSSKIDYRMNYPEKIPGSGLIIPFCDSPIDNEPVGENVYINILNSAKNYCWFMSPYLVLSDELNRAFVLAAKRGVDVRIITPGVPDKKTVYSVTRSYYKYLALNGVKIYEYTPGFEHAKMCISDDSICVVGTINLDYRSLFHHFEDAVAMYNCDCIADVLKDFNETIDSCRDVTEKSKQKTSILIDFAKSLLRLVAPLL